MTRDGVVPFAADDSVKSPYALGIFLQVRGGNTFAVIVSRKIFDGSKCRRDSVSSFIGLFHEGTWSCC